MLLSVFLFRQYFLNGQIAVRTMTNESRPYLFLVIPGGPNISSKYMDSFFSDLNLPSTWEIGILNLPNHEESKMSEKITLNYPAVLDLIVKSLGEIKRKYSRVVLFGHSFGARLVLDALSRGVDVDAAICSAMPIEFKSSAEVESKLSAMPLASEPITSNEAFLKFWRAILPLYFYNPPNQECTDKMCNEAFYIGNETHADSAPVLDRAAPTIQSRQNDITFLHGDHDIIVPDKNTDSLKMFFPRSSHIVFSNTGHFPMIEKAHECSLALRKIVSDLGSGR